MRLWQRSTPSRQLKAPPTEIYISLVDSLFSDARSLFIGSIAASGTAFVSAWKTGEPLLYVCALAMALVACARAADMRAYAKRRSSITSVEAAARWETRYVVGAAAYVALLGAWCMISFARTSDDFVHLLSFSATLAYLIGISGRNFASSRLVTAQIIFAGGPMAVALFFTGDAFYAIFGIVLLPFFASLKFISDRLRRTLLDAVIATRDVSLLASRFDTALNNMPHGLCMFDARR